MAPHTHAEEIRKDVVLEVRDMVKIKNLRALRSSPLRNDEETNGLITGQPAI